ncbi:hypothetical protein OHA25_41970 [Nonomuraea sp. NBC_00507]|uniref:hypothetical protein n=1 Tax=Nonomuraea sp. NBC_00507 TaxID=2976002 RepID=UPI002E18B020
MTPDEIATYYAQRGLVAIDGYDRQRILDSIRESRRRYAHEDASQAIDDAVAMIRPEFVRELGPNPGAVDVLLHVAFSLGPFAHHGMDGANILNIIARLADDSNSRPPRDHPRHRRRLVRRNLRRLLRARRRHPPQLRGGGRARRATDRARTPRPRNHLDRGPCR